MMPEQIKYTWSKRERSDRPDVVHVDFTPDKINFVSVDAQGRKTLSIGIGDRKEVTLRKLHLIARQVIATAKSNQIKKISFNPRDFVYTDLKLRNRQLAELIAVNFEMANFEFVRYKTMPPEGWNFVEEVHIVGNFSVDMQEGVERGKQIARAVNGARVLANTPGGEMTPTRLAETAQEATKGLPIRMQVLGRDDIKILGMGGILGVAQGSSEELKFIVMEYWGTNKKDKPIVLVGKGVTFDSGGLNLKPDPGIYEMHMDMSGGAAVINALLCAARLKLKCNIVALVPSAENMPSGSSYRPGDVLKTMSGKTIEVLNTDAEGRILLADALTYAEKYKPRIVIDVATLTGAAMAALGQRASAIFTKDKRLETITRDCGEESGDYVWPLPLWDEYEEDIKGTFGDWSNTSKTKYGGAITGAMFLYQFVKSSPSSADSGSSSSRTPTWLHIDIAPTMTSIDGQYLAKGATGSPVRLLIKLLETL